MSSPPALVKPSPAPCKLKTVLLFLVLGPPVGGLLAFFVTLYAQGYFSSFETRYISRGFAWLPVVWESSYVVGGIPAALSDLLVARMNGQSAKSSLKSMPWFAAIGAVISSLYAVCVLTLNFVITSRFGGNISIITFLAVLSAVAAMVCGYIALRAGWLAPPPNAKELAK